MKDDALVRQLRAQREAYIEARDRAELTAKTYPNSDIVRASAAYCKALDAAIGSVDAALKMDGNV